MKKLLFLLSFVLTIVGFSLNANGQQTVFDPCTRTICGNFVSAQGGALNVARQTGTVPHLYLRCRWSCRR